jgi:hypothetical protein
VIAALYTLPTTRSPMILIVSSVWDFGDGTTSTVKDPIHNYSYLVLLCLTHRIYNRGCIRTMYDTIRVPRTPDPIITSLILFVSFECAILLAVSLLRIPNTYGVGFRQRSNSRNKTPIRYITPWATLQSRLRRPISLAARIPQAKVLQLFLLPQINLASDPTVISELVLLSRLRIVKM